MKMQVSILSLISLLCFQCGEKKPRANQDKSKYGNHFPFVTQVIELGDTARIEIETYGNKVIKHFIDLKGKSDNGFDNSYDVTSTFHEKLNDTSIYSRFYITINEYNIYFDEKSVAQYCDSLSNQQENEIRKLHYQNLKRFVLQQKITDNNPLSDIPNKRDELLVNFNGKIVNSISGDRPRSLLIESHFTELSGAGGKMYHIIDNKGDTILLGQTIDYYQ